MPERTSFQRIESHRKKDLSELISTTDASARVKIAQHYKMTNKLWRLSLYVDFSINRDG